MHRSLDEFEIQSDPTMCFTTRPRYQVSVYRTIGPLVDLIILILAGKEDMHESLDEFEFRQICNRVTALD